MSKKYDYGSEEEPGGFGVEIIVLIAFLLIVIAIARC